MRIRHAWAISLLLASAAAFPLSGNTVATDNVKARLVSEVGSVAPGQSFWVALEFDIREGWHTYWRNPGDSGLPTRLTWTLPRGFSAGPIVWTVPHRFVLAPLINYGYAKHAVHLIEITAPTDLAVHGPVTLQAKANWLVCSNVCIPESADLKLTLPTSAKPASADANSEPLFAAARNELPQAAPAPAEAQIHGGRLFITIGRHWGRSLEQIESLSFIPYDDGQIAYAAPQTMRRSADAIELSLKPGYRPQTAGAIRGLLLVTENDGGGRTVPLEIAARFASAPPAEATRGPHPRIAAAAVESRLALLRPGEAKSPALGILLLSAVLGGLVLNLMPCVFPVLSVKAVGIVEQARKHPRTVRLKGLVFAAGVIGSMWTLTTVLLVLRAGGEQIGWGFQLQSPLFVTLMAYLLLVVGLNLSGVFEFGGALAGIGDELTRGHGYRASFFTGLLTTLVATPCTAPFMAPAVGAALTQAPAVAFVIFTALGVGLALPYLLICFAPGLRRALPKPGAWMDTLKQVFAFPMYASAAWLLWVLAQQTSAVGLGAAFAGFVLVALAAWAYQKSKSRAGHARNVAIVASAAALLIAIALPVGLEVSPASAFAAPAHGAATIGDGWQPYDPARAAELRAAGKPLLINFTASWCLTCLINERNAFADPSVQATLRKKGVTLMKGDWTNRDPRITTALAAFGRAGVPLYVVYNANPSSAEPLVLPQLLTAGVVQGAFAALPDRESR